MIGHSYEQNKVDINVLYNNMSVPTDANQYAHFRSIPVDHDQHTARCHSICRGIVFFLLMLFRVLIYHSLYLCCYFMKPNDLWLKLTSYM